MNRGGGGSGNASGLVTHSIKAIDTLPAASRGKEKSDTKKKKKKTFV